MCGRYTQLRSWSELVRIYRIGTTNPALNLPALYNAAPTQRLPVIKLGEHGERRIELLRWGLIPSWAKDPKIGYATINARAETVDQKPAFRAAFLHRRCVVPADGFYEWRDEGGPRKQAYYIGLPATAAFAGLWELWRPPSGEPVESFAIVVTPANDQIAPIHDRMPAILDGETAIAAWLEPAARAESLKARLAPFDESLSIRRVGAFVNNVRNDGPDCLSPIDGNE